jgi:hypothetical protein
MHADEGATIGRGLDDIIVIPRLVVHTIAGKAGPYSARGAHIDPALDAVSGHRDDGNPSERVF